MEYKKNYLIIYGKESVKLRSGSMKFKNNFKQLPAPFEIYADSECALKKVKSNDKNSEKYQDRTSPSINDKFSKKVVPINEKNESINSLKQS